MQEIKNKILELISEKDFEKELKEKKKKYSGLLSDDDIIRLIAKEKGLQLKPINTDISLISDLVPGKQANILGLISQIYPLKTFRRGTGYGKMQSLVIQDSSGETRLTFWQQDLEKVEKLQRGATYVFYSLEPKEFNGKIYLNFGSDSFFEEKSGAPKQEIKYTKIDELKPEMYDVNLKVKIQRVFPPKEFMRENRKGKLVNFMIMDSTGTLKATAWTENADTVLSFPEDTVVTIESGYTKEGMQGLELHLGYKSRIYKINEKIDAQSFDLMAQNLPKKKISELSPDTKSTILVQAEVSEIEEKKYSVCKKCSGKLEKDSEICTKCGETKPLDKKFAILTLEQDNDKIKALVFEPDINLLNSEGKKIEIIGYLKINNFSNDLELIAKAYRIL